MQNIVLIGFMGSGKSTVARRLSKLIKKSVVDTDALIEERVGMSIKDFFAKYGEDEFRKIECEIRDELAKKQDLVISCGGGFARLENLKKMGFVIFLDLQFFRIKSRLKNDTKRPLFDESAKKLYEQRLPKYNANCHIKINPMDIKPRQLVQILELFLRVKLNENLQKARIKNAISPKRKMPLKNTKD